MKSWAMLIKIDEENVEIKLKLMMRVRRRGKNLSHEEWEMINPDYTNRLFFPSPSHRTLSPGRFSTASPNAYPMSPWIMLPTLPVNCPEAPHSFRCVASMVKPRGQIYSIAVAEDGLLYTGSDSKDIRVCRHLDFLRHTCLTSGSANVKVLLVAGDQILSPHGDNKIRIWRRSRSNPDVHTRLSTLPKLNIFQNLTKPLVTDQGTGRAKHSGPVTCLAYDANDDLLYSASLDNTVKVWKVSESKCMETIAAHNEAVNAVVVRHDGLLFTGSDDNMVKVWRRQARGRPKHQQMMTLNMQRSPVKALALGPDGSPVLYAGCYDGYIHYWEEDQFSDRILHYSGFLRGHLHSVFCLQTVRDLLFSGSADTTIRVWKREAGGTGICCIAVLEGHSGPVKCIAVSIMDFQVNSFIVYSGSLDGMMKVWMGCLKTTMGSRPTSPLRIR